MANQEMRISDAELSLIKNTFAGNDDMLKLFRKIFLPAITADAPLGQNVDLWMTIKIDDMTPEMAYVNLKARQSVISHVEGCLMQLKMLAGSKTESVEETKEKLKKNSSK